MRFDRFAEGVTRQVTRPWFFWITVAVLVAWIPTMFLLDSNISDLIIDAISNTVSLVLLILLQNSQTRGQKAQDSRTDQVERSLALLLQAQARRETDPAARRDLADAAQALVKNAEETEMMEEGT